MSIATKRITATLLSLFIVMAMVASVTVTASATLVTNKLLTLDEAKSVALKHADVAAADATFVKTTNYLKKGVYVYDLEFTTATTKYFYQINRTNSAVISYSTKLLANVNNNGNNNNSYITNHGHSGYHGNPHKNTTTTLITAEEAKAIALKHAGVSASSVSNIKCKLDEDDGVMIYEVEFKTKGSSKFKYEYEINASTGKILDWEYDD